MPARTKGRVKFDFRGRAFLWWIDGDRWLRIYSYDKKFVIAYPMGIEDGFEQAVGVIGSEFPGLAEKTRPIWLAAPNVSCDSIGAWVDGLLRWAFGTERELRQVRRPRLIGERADDSAKQ